MSIHFVSGKPGGGKTLYSVRLIVDELVNGHRPVVTNVSLKLGELNAYLQTKHPGAYERGMANGVHITDRVHLIDEYDIPIFFTFRGDGVRVGHVTNGEWKAGKRPDFKVVRDSGIFYVLDEVHVAFNSRAWADTGAEVLYYLSQHRKLGDDVVCITQSVANVDKQFRSVAQDFTYIKNLAKQRAGLFRLPSIFTRATYAQPATDTAQAMETGTFTLDVAGLAACYDTAKGVGIHGRAGADTKERRGGIHWLWFVVGAPLCLWFLLHYLPLMVGHALAPPGRGAVHGAVAPPAVAPVASGARLSVPPVAEPVVVMQVVQVVQEPVARPAATNEYFCKGYVMLGKNEGLVYLSNGSGPDTIVDLSSGRIRELATTYVVVDGVKLPIRKGSSVLAPVLGARSERVVEGDMVAPVLQDGGFRPPFGGVVVAPGVGGR